MVARTGSERRTVELDGLAVHVFVHDDRRNAEGPVVLLIHGAGGSSLQWPPRLRRMPGTLVYAPDLPGHGASTGKGFGEVGAYASFASRLIAVLGVQHAAAIGHSMGSAIALELARLHAGITAIGVVAGGERLPISENLLELICADFQAATRRIVEATFGRDTSPEMRSLFVRRLREVDAETFYGDLAACQAFDARQYAGDLEIPTLIVAGDQDKMVPPALSRALHKRMPNSRLEILAGAGHMIQWERTEQLLGMLTQLAG